jgi:FG-GAP repeat.
MRTSILFSTRLLSLILAGILLHNPLTFADGCDLRMFAGARLFGAAASAGIEFMATADFNHDGLLDVVTTDSSNTVSVLLANGDGTFQPAVKYTVPSPKNPAVADFNRDGKLDLAIWSSFSTVVMLGNGDGTFKAPIAASAQGGAQAVGSRWAM